jgi:glycosyltransferase involved in cell wall biosynthesis
MNASPLVSIVIPCFNSEAFLSELLDCLSQLDSRFEFIFVDDGSTDSTRSILEDYVNGSNRSSLITHGSNLGLSSARNTGIRAVRGKLIQFLDSDDCIDPGMLQAALDAWQEEPSDVFFFRTSVFSDGSGDPQALKKYQNYYARVPSVGRYTEPLRLLSGLLKDSRWKPSACLYFADSRVVRENDLSFSEGYLMEDNAFTMCLFLAARQVTYSGFQAHRRRIRSDSISFRTDLAAERGAGLIKAAIDISAFSSKRELPKPLNKWLRLHTLRLAEVGVASFSSSKRDSIELRQDIALLHDALSKKTGGFSVAQYFRRLKRSFLGKLES